MRFLISALVVFCCVSFVQAQDDPLPKLKKAPAGPVDKLEAGLQKLKEEFSAKGEKLAEQFKETKTPQEQRKLIQQAQALEEQFLAAAFEMAKSDPASPTALSIFVAQINNPDKTAEAAIALLEKHHATSPKITELCFALVENPEGPEALDGLLQVIIDKNTDRRAQGSASLAKAALLKGRLDAAETKGAANQDKLATDAEKALEEIATKFADIKLAEPTEKLKTIGDKAKSILFALQHLRVGKSPPEIAGIDSSAEKFKLSDYQGKVVLLDFWADWCGPCMAMVPHARNTVKRLEGKPFAIVGVNASDSKEVQKETETTNKMTWKSFHDGSDGPISAEYRIAFFPTIYVLDHTGVIRYKNIRGEELDKAIDKLVEAAENAKPNKK